VSLFSTRARGAHHAVVEPSLIREEPATQPASPLPRTEEAEERGLPTDFSEPEEDPGKDL
jgi:hypothetical protein